MFLEVKIPPLFISNKGGYIYYKIKYEKIK